MHRNLISAAPDYIFLYKLFMWGVRGALLNCGFEGTNPLLVKTNAILNIRFTIKQSYEIVRLFMLKKERITYIIKMYFE